MNKKLLHWLLVIGLIMIIYALSNIPNFHIIPENTIPLWLKNLIGRYTIKFGTTGYFSYTISLHPDYILHKIGHIIAFGTLGVAIYWAVDHLAIRATILTAVVATLDEWHQSFVPGRSSRFGDVILDTLATIFFIWIMRYLNQRKRGIY